MKQKEINEDADDEIIFVTLQPRKRNKLIKRNHFHLLLLLLLL